MTSSIAPDIRELIESTRRVNKALSVYVFALQEQGGISADRQMFIAEMLVALANTIRAQASLPIAAIDGEALSSCHAITGATA